MSAIAVLTGDLIHSRDSASPQALLTQLQQLLEQLAEQWPARHEVFRGDGFQVIPADPRSACRWALALRAGLIGASPAGERWDARIAIGIGAPPNAEDAYGQAQVLSGQGLDGMKRGSLGLFCADAELRERGELPTAFVEAIIDDWTPVEAHTFHLALTHDLDHQGLAALLGKSRATVTQALQRAQARLLERYLAKMRGWQEALA